MLEKHVMPTPPLPTNLVTQVLHKALPSVFVIGVSGAGRFGWTGLDWAGMGWSVLELAGMGWNGLK